MTSARKDPPVERRRRIAVLYFSGAGGTELVARMLSELLAARHEASALGIGDARSFGLAADCEFLVLCYPTYYLRPAPSMREFIASLGPFSPPRAAYIVTTYELYAENSIRSAAFALKKRGVSTLGWKAVRSPGSDLSCVAPAWLIPRLYRFERGLPRKLLEMADEIETALGLRDSDASLGPRASIPAPKWYTPLAQTLQVLALNHFDRLKWRFRVLRDRCSLCGACVVACGRGALRISGGSLSHDPGRCELCTRCIHRCPRRAIVLLKALKDNRRLDPGLYAVLRSEAERSLVELGAITKDGRERVDGGRNSR
jgi:ferredoxin/flavodoxin